MAQLSFYLKECPFHPFFAHPLCPFFYNSFAGRATSPRRSKLSVAGTVVGSSSPISSGLPISKNPPGWIISHESIWLAILSPAHTMVDSDTNKVRWSPPAGVSHSGYPSGTTKSPSNARTIPFKPPRRCQNIIVWRAFCANGRGITFNISCTIRTSGSASKPRAKSNKCFSAGCKTSSAASTVERTQKSEVKHRSRKRSQCLSNCRALRVFFELDPLERAKRSRSSLAS